MRSYSPISFLDECDIFPPHSIVAQRCGKLRIWKFRCFSGGRGRIWFRWISWTFSVDGSVFFGFTEYNRWDVGQNSFARNVERASFPSQIRRTTTELQAPPPSPSSSSLMRSSSAAAAAHVPPGAGPPARRPAHTQPCHATRRAIGPRKMTGKRCAAFCCGTGACCAANEEAVLRSGHFYHTKWWGISQPALPFW